MLGCAKDQILRSGQRLSPPPQASYRKRVKELRREETSFPRSRPATLPLCHLPSLRGFPNVPRWEGLPSRPEDLGTHLGAASAAGPRALTVVFVTVPPPRHVARRCAAKPRCWAGRAAGTVGTPAGARTAASRAERPARRRTCSRRLPEA